MEDPKKKSSRKGIDLGFGKKDMFKEWDVGTKYKCEKLLG
jgi:hypothetical protein